MILLPVKFDSITDTQVFLKVISFNEWRATFLELNTLSDIKRNFIDRDDVFLKPGTSIILDKYAQAQLNLEKAQKQQKIGGILTITGSVTVISLFVIGSQTNMSLEAAGIIFVAGTAIALIGLPIYIIGSTRVNKFKNTLSDKVFIEIAPCIFHNYMANSCPSGATLRIRF